MSQEATLRTGFKFGASPHIQPRMVLRTAHQMTPRRLSMGRRWWLRRRRKFASWMGAQKAAQEAPSTTTFRRQVAQAFAGAALGDPPMSSMER